VSVAETLQADELCSWSPSPSFLCFVVDDLCLCAWLRGLWVFASSPLAGIPGRLCVLDLSSSFRGALDGDVDPCVYGVLENMVLFGHWYLLGGCDSWLPRGSEGLKLEGRMQRK
jgi:hypothetical protein